LCEFEIQYFGKTTKFIVVDLGRDEKIILNGPKRNKMGGQRLD